MLPKENQSFDPAKIPDAIKKAGFSVPKIEIVAKGTAEKWKDMFALRVFGQQQVFVLAGGEQITAFQQKIVAGNQVRITGIFHGSHGDAPPGLTVEKFEITP